MREMFHLSDQEVNLLLQGIRANGEEAMYKQMQGKIFSNLLGSENMDDMVMDMYPYDMEEAIKMIEKTPLWREIKILDDKVQKLIFNPGGNLGLSKALLAKLCT